jgi:hypothetical protein
MIANDLSSICYPGRIVEFFPETQTATVLICAELITHSSSAKNVATLREPIQGVPVHTTGGGGYHVTLPVKEGDTCVLYFSQVGYDHWLYKDEDVAGEFAGMPETWLSRQFDEDDGFALVGFNTLNRKVTEFQEDRAEFRNIDRTTRISILDDGSAELAAGGTTITITADGDITIVANDTVAITGDVTVSGDIDCQGTITGEVDCLGGGVSLKSHTHGITGGSSAGNTAVPN